MKSSSTAGPREPSGSLSVTGNFIVTARSNSHTIGILHRDNLLVVVEVVEERSEDSPASVKLIVTDEVAVVTLQGIQDQGLVRLGDLEVGETTAVGQVQLGDDGLHGQTGELGVHLDVDGFVGLNTDDELVTRNVLEDARGNVAELDTDLRLLFVQGCSSVSGVNAK